MQLLNLTVGEWLAMLLPLSGLLLILYLYQRIRRRQTVSSLRFWPRQGAGPRAARRRKLHEPLSLLLQWLALLFLLLAIAEPLWRSRTTPLAHHVLILETSVWMNAQSGDGTLMERAREGALAYLRAIPAGDPVMLIRADALATPATRFTAAHPELQKAIRESVPGGTPLDLAGALNLARNSLRLQLAGMEGAATAGEIAYIGAGRIAESDQGRIRTDDIPHLRFIPLGAEVGNLGLRRLNALADPAAAGRWEVTVEVFNYGQAPVAGRVDFTFGSQGIGGRAVQVNAQSAHEFTFRLTTSQAGSLRALLTPEDSFAADNSASIPLPLRLPQPATIYSDQPDRLRPLLAAIPGLTVQFSQRLASQRPGESPGREGAFVVFDRVAPDAPSDGLYLRPPVGPSLPRVARVVRQARVTRWARTHPLAQGLRDRDVTLPEVSIFELEAGDEVIAESEAGPVIVARTGDGHKRVFFGFDPAATALRHTLAAPLLVANAVRWLAPDVFRGLEIVAAAPGLVETETLGEAEESVEVSSPENPNLPWSWSSGGRLRFFAGQPGAVRVRTPSRQMDFSLTLPQVGAANWEPPENVLRGIPPPRGEGSAASVALWRWLALASLLCLLIDWIFFGRRPAQAAAVESQTQPPRAGPAWPDTGLSMTPKTPEEQVTR
jgi:Ca-activated chloride channel homolog